MWYFLIAISAYSPREHILYSFDVSTVVPTKSDSDVIFGLQLLSKTLILHFIWANTNWKITCVLILSCG